MTIIVNDTKINYIDYGNKNGNVVVLLHGWGQNIEMMKMLGDPFQKEYHITILDLPGFGESEEPNYVWSVFDYVEYLHAFLESLSIKKPIIVGHSFGGRLAIRYSSNHPIEKLVLLGAPCIRVETKLPLYIKILKYLKTLPFLDSFGEYMKKYIGSRDYKAASPIMRKVLVNTVNEDLSNYAKQIEEPTLLIWGDRDTEAPVEEAKELEKIMIDAALIILPGSHYAYIENLQQVVNILNNFFGGE